MTGAVTDGSCIGQNRIEFTIPQNHRRPPEGVSAGREVSARLANGAHVPIAIQNVRGRIEIDKRPSSRFVSIQVTIRRMAPRAGPVFI